MSSSFIFLDLDDCLFSIHGGSMPAEAIIWLQKYVMAANIGLAPQIKICTGRNIPFVSAILYMMGRPTGAGFSVLENGSVFYSTDTREFLINPQISRRALRQLRLVREKIGPKIEKKHPDLWIYPGNIINTVFLRKRQSALTRDSAKKIIRKIILQELNSIEETAVKERLSRRRKIARKIFSPLVRFNRRRRMPAVNIMAFGDGVAVVPRGVDKGAAIKYLAKKEGLNLKKCLGIGNSGTDVRFLTMMGFVGCPSNADSLCADLVAKKRGKKSLLPCISGVVDIIREYTQVKDIGL